MSDAPADEDCLFCKIVAGDIEADVVHETPTTVAFRDLNPQAPTHVLVIPRSHYPNAAALAAGEPATAADLFDRRRGDRRERGSGGGLPARLQHRRRGPPDRLPRPPARPRRPRHDLAAGMTLAGPRRTTALAVAVRPGPPALRLRHQRRARPPEHAPPSRRPPATQPADEAARRATHDATGRGRAGAAQAAARGGAAGHGADAGGLHAVGPHRRRHRRLPLLPARPEGAQRPVHHRLQHAAGQPRRGAPRHPVPRAAGQGRRGGAEGRRDARPGLDLLRQLRARQRARDRRRTVAGRLGARRQRADLRQGVRREARPRAPAWSCRCTTTCSRARSPTAAPPSCGWRRSRDKIRAARDPAAARRRSSCRAAPSTATASCATAPRPSRTSRSASATARARPPTCCTSSAGRSRPARCSPAPGRSLSPRRSAASPATCTCSGRSIKIEVNPGRPGARTLLDIPVWDFDNQGSRPIKPAALKPGDTLKVTCRHTQELRDRLPSFEGHPGQVRRLGRGHHRRDVPRHPAGHPPLSAASTGHDGAQRTATRVRCQ